MSSLHEAGTEARTHGHQSGRINAMMVDALLSRIESTTKAIISRYQQETKRNQIIETTRKLIGQQKENEQSSQSSSVQTKESLNSSSSASADEIQQMAKDWERARKALASDDSLITREDRISLLQKMQSIQNELGKIKLAEAVIRSNVVSTAQELTQTREPERESNADQKRERSWEDWDTEPQRQPETRARREPPEPAIEEQQEINIDKPPEPQNIVDKRTVVQTADALADTRQNQKADQPQELEPILVYAGEEYNIYVRDETTTITDKEGHALFAYTRDGDNVTVKKDEITQHPDRMKDFETANAGLKKHGIDKIQSDMSRRLEAKSLGGLAREGSRAIAIAASVTDREQLKTTKSGYTFERTGDSFSVYTANPKVPPSEKMTVDSSRHGISVQKYSKEDRDFFKERYPIVMTNVEKATNRQAAAQAARDNGRPVLRDRGGAER